MPANRTFAVSLISGLSLVGTTVSAAPPQPQQATQSLPPIGSDAGGGYTVAAHWHVTYIFKAHIWAPTLQRPNGQLIAKHGPPHWYEQFRAEADVIEERDKWGNPRGVVRGGTWKYAVKDVEYFTNVGQHVGFGGASASGSFSQEPEARGQAGIFATTSISYGTTQADGHYASFELSAPYGKGVDSPHLDFSYPGLGVIVRGVDRGLMKLEGELHEHRSLPFFASMRCTVPYTEGSINWHKVFPRNQGSTEITITRTALTAKGQPRIVKVEIKPRTANWKDWLPTAPGYAEFEARIVEPQGASGQWKISLQSSSLPGVCNNADLVDLPPEQPGALAAQWEGKIQPDSFDLFFDFRKYGRTDLNFKPVASPWKVLETAKPSNSVTFSVECLDFGAYGKVAAQALVDGQWQTAVFKETGEKFVRIPWAPNSTEDDHIADAAKPFHSDAAYPKGHPRDDIDNTPSSTQALIGDGLNVFEEYRGFFVGDDFHVASNFRHRRLDPNKKDLFIFSESFAADLLPFLGEFQNSSGLNVFYVGLADSQHFVRVRDHLINFNSPDASPSQTIDFNRAQSSGKPQCALFLKHEDLGQGMLGNAPFGPPKYNTRVAIDMWQAPDVDAEWERKGQPGLLRQITVHELGHGIGILHHGDSNDGSKGVAREGGQNSGDVFCAMRYNHWRWFQHRPSANEPSPKPQRYRSDREHPAFGYCDSPLGTGINKIGTEDWQCGDASPGRGNCLSQIRVNDRAPRQTGSGSGHWTEPKSQPTTGEEDAAEKTAQDSQRRAAVALGFRVGNADRIYPGEAVIFELLVRKSKSGATGDVSHLGSGAKRWAEQVTFMELAKDGKLVPLAFKLRPIGRTEAQIDLKPDARHQALFAADGSETAKLPAGLHRIVAVISPDKSSITSHRINLVVADPPADAAGQKQAETKRKLSQARFECAAERWPEAEKITRIVIVESPDLLEAHLLLARILEKQANLKEAHDEYARALELVPKDAEEPPDAILTALTRLEEKLGLEPKPPATTAAAPESAYSLRAESPTGEMGPPFSSAMTKLVLDWKLPPGASTDPIGARWIAVDTGAALPNDHVISSDKSDPGKTSGTFTLAKPSGGFVSGKYRVELWQAGKKIHEETFEIRPP